MAKHLLTTSSLNGVGLLTSEDTEECSRCRNMDPSLPDACATGARAQHGVVSFSRMIDGTACMAPLLLQSHMYELCDRCAQSCALLTCSPSITDSRTTASCMAIIMQGAHSYLRTVLLQVGLALREASLVNPMIGAAEKGSLILQELCTCAWCRFPGFFRYAEDA